MTGVWDNFASPEEGAVGPAEPCRFDQFFERNLFKEWEYLGLEPIRVESALVAIPFAVVLPPRRRRRLVRCIRRRSPNPDQRKTASNLVPSRPWKAEASDKALQHQVAAPIVRDHFVAVSKIQATSGVLFIDAEAQSLDSRSLRYLLEGFEKHATYALTTMPAPHGNRDFGSLLINVSVTVVLGREESGVCSSDGGAIELSDHADVADPAPFSVVPGGFGMSEYDLDLGEMFLGIPIQGLIEGALEGA